MTRPFPISRLSMLLTVTAGVAAIATIVCMASPPDEMLSNSREVLLATSSSPPIPVFFSVYDVKPGGSFANGDSKVTLDLLVVEPKHDVASHSVGEVYATSFGLSAPEVLVLAGTNGEEFEIAPVHAKSTQEREDHVRITYDMPSRVVLGSRDGIDVCVISIVLRVHAPLDKLVDLRCLIRHEKLMNTLRQMGVWKTHPLVILSPIGLDGWVRYK